MAPKKSEKPAVKAPEAKKVAKPAPKKQTKAVAKPAPKKLGVKGGKITKATSKLNFQFLMQCYRKCGYA